VTARIGELRLDPVTDGTGRFPPTASYRGSTDEQWRLHAGLLDADGLLGFSVGGFLLRGNGEVTLVDLGLGHRSLFGMRGGAFLRELAALGVRPADVTNVIFTHLHLDHIGWASEDDGRPVFPRATYRCAWADWEYFVDGQRGEEHRLLAPLRDRWTPWERSGPLLAGVDVLDAPGHTPGSSLVVVSSDRERAVLLGDVVHCPVELLDAEWAGLGDVDPELARRTREAFAREFEDSQVPLAAAHFPGLAFGRLLRGEGGRAWSW
jgi:glyoxylase-like metal-dependent hydrolase (beta-lactamase superfamily II)